MYTRLLPLPETSFLLLGPRGTGKTTWLEQRLPNAAGYDLLRTDERLRLARDPSAFAAECEALPDGSWVIVDEVQRVPELLDEAQRLMTRRGQQFALTGSSARKLRRGGANLLAGRAEVLHLFPFVAKELGFRRDLEPSLKYGMLPLAVSNSKPGAFLRSYCDTYLHEEIQAEALVRNIGSFGRFLEVAARLNGQTINVSGVARDAAVARPTVQDFFEILVDTLIGSWLPAWKLKRGVKQVAHPKFYFFDCGVVRQLAGLGHLEIHPEERGFLLETYLLHEIRAWLHYTGRHWPVSYWRTHDGTEVDFVIETPKRWIAVEVKSSERWEPGFQRGLLALRSALGTKETTLIGIYRGRRPLVSEGVNVRPVGQFLRDLWESGLD